MSKWAIGIDIGKSHIGSATVVADGLKTIRSFNQPIDGGTIRLGEFIDSLSAHIGECKRGNPEESFAGIGIGAPAQIDSEGRMTNENFPCLNQFVVPLPEHFENWFGAKCTLVNDAQAAAFAEWRHGAGVMAERMLYFVISSGVGGAYVQNGVVHNGEFGRCVVTTGPRATDLGWVERFANSAWFEAQKPYREKAHLLALRADKGDAAARAVFNRMGKTLGLAVSSIMNIFDPHVVVFGGGISRASEHFLPAVKKQIGEHAKHLSHVPLVQSHFGHDAGIVGAAMYAFRSDQHPPK